jgi:hypothetical protein
MDKIHSNPSDSYYTGNGGYSTLERASMMTIEWTKMILDDDDDRSRSEYYSHCATTALLTDDSAKLPNTLVASSLADTITESANKDSENDTEEPDLDTEHVHVSEAIHELLMDIDIDSDEDQVHTSSGGISGGIPKRTTVAPEADNHKESLHFFPNNQQVTVRHIKNRNMLPEGALTDDVLDTINTTHDLCRFFLSCHSIKRFFFNLDVIHPCTK